jgi:hypothetical protein
VERIVYFKGYLSRGLLTPMTHSFQEQENGKGESLETEARFNFPLAAPEFVKSPMINKVCILCYNRENTR